MQFLYIVIAMMVSIGIGTFSGSDAQHRTAKTIDDNRAVAFQEQSQIFARSVRRQVQMHPGQYRSVQSGNGQVQLDDTQLQAAEFGGYRMHGRYRYILDNTGRIISDLALEARRGPNGLHEIEDSVVELIMNPPEGRAVGRLDLTKLGLRD